MGKSALGMHPVDRGPVETITVHADIPFNRRDGHKRVLAPGGSPASPLTPRDRPNDALVNALGRAFRWRKLIETGVYATAAEMASAAQINESYLSRVLRLTLLPPDVVEAALDGRHTNLVLSKLLAPLPSAWTDQRSMLQKQGP